MSLIQTQDSRAKVWLMAIRPKTLWAGATPVLIGSALAADGGAFYMLPALAALLGALLIQIGTNLSNDYSDYFKGADTEDRLGPVRVTQAGLIKPQVMKGAIIVAFGLAFLPGAYIIARGGPVFLFIGLVSILSGVLYTSGPYPLGYFGLGELFVLVFFGPVATAGTYYLHTLSLDPYVVLAGLAPGLFSVAILTVNNLRDIDGDKRAGKKTLAVRFGPAFAKGEYIGALVLAGLGIPALLCLLTGGHYYSLAGALALVAAIPSARTVLFSTDGPALNRALANTSKALLLFSVLFSIGWLI